jgi:hypothetical protein
MSKIYNRFLFMRFDRSLILKCSVNALKLSRKHEDKQKYFIFWQSIPKNSLYTGTDR